MAADGDNAQLKSKYANLFWHFLIKFWNAKLIQSQFLCVCVYMCRMRHSEFMLRQFLFLSSSFWFYVSAFRRRIETVYFDGHKDGMPLILRS